MDKSQKVASSVTFLIMPQILIDLISQGIQIKVKNFLFSFEPNEQIHLGNKQKLPVPGTNKKLDLGLPISFNPLFVHPKVPQTEHSSKLGKLHNI